MKYFKEINEKLRIEKMINKLTRGPKNRLNTKALEIFKVEDKSIKGGIKNELSNADL